MPIARLHHSVLIGKPVSMMRVVRSVLALLGIALLLAIGARVWVRRREAAAHVRVSPASASVAVPVATPAEARAPVPVSVAAGAVGSEPTAGPAAADGDTGSSTGGADTAAPAGFTIKAKQSSGLYHTPSSPAWSRMHADAWFETEETAQAAGFKRWDWRRDRS